MRRRDFISLAGGAVASPLAARAQQRAVPVIGYLAAGTLETTNDIVAAVHRGLAEMGYIEGRNLRVEYRWAEYRLDRMAALADELVQRQVAVIVVLTTPALLAAKAATRSIPIVFLTGADPVEAGLVASLNRPGGNLTGMANLNVEVMAKRLQLLHDVAPSRLTAFLFNPSSSVVSQAETKQLVTAASTLGTQLLPIEATSAGDFEGAFVKLSRARAGALAVSTDVLFATNLTPLIELAERHGVPAIYPHHRHAFAGGLMSYSTDDSDLYRKVGIYTGRILNGEKTAELPVERATKMQLVINLKTAKALGIIFPTGILVRADEVIE